MATSLSKVLITGATGNVGMAVLKALQKTNHALEIIAGVRNPENQTEKLRNYIVRSEKFDFTDTSTYKPAFQDCDILFLVRPPQITNTEKYFKPLIQAAKNNDVKHLIFLSVQGVQKSSIIPHHKIERQIIASNLPYTFLRPAYFMQNFTTTLRNDLINKQRIFLPAGKTKFTLVDVSDIGNVTAAILTDVSLHQNKAYELTCSQKLSFKEMAMALSRELGVAIDYQSPNLLNFYFAKRKEKVSSDYILVLIMLHYLPRFQKEPVITDCIKKIAGTAPIEFDQFLSNNRSLLMG